MRVRVHVRAQRKQEGLYLEPQSGMRWGRMGVTGMINLLIYDIEIAASNTLKDHFPQMFI